MVIWLTGLAGSGKTTIGGHLYALWKAQAPNTVLVDGDDTCAQETITMRRFSSASQPPARSSIRARTLPPTTMTRSITSTTIMVDISRCGETRSWPNG